MSIIDTITGAGGDIAKGFIKNAGKQILTDTIRGAIETVFGGSSIPASRGKVGQFAAMVNDRGIAFDSYYIVNMSAVSGDRHAIDLASFFCAGAQIPALNLMTTSYREYHAHYELPYNVSYEPVTMNFYGDRSMIIKRFFDEWFARIYNKSNNKIAFPDSYRFNIDIIVLDKQDINNPEGVYKVTLHNAYPKTIGDIQLSANSSNAVIFPVTFVYEYMNTDYFTTTEAISASIQANAAASLPGKVSFPFNLIEDVKKAANGLMSPVLEGISGVVQTGKDWISGQVTGVETSIRSFLTGIGPSDKPKP